MGPLVAKTTIEYLKPLPLYRYEKPYEVTIPIWHVPDARGTNLATSAHGVEIMEMSNALEEFSTDIQGFQAESFPTSLSNEDLSEEAILRAKYFEECKGFLRTRFGAQEVFFFDHMFRKSGIEVQLAGVTEYQRLLQPAMVVHVDQTAESARRRVAYCLPDDAQRLLKGRVRILNIWRPLFSPLEDHPLALCDFRSVKKSDLVASDLLSPHYEGEQYYLTHNSEHKWWFKMDMGRDEVLVIKCYDSEGEVEGSNIAEFAPHTSFDWDGIPNTARPRESMEVRALVFSNL